jgi:carboxymethylenebutenolidase
MQHHIEVHVYPDAGHSLLTDGHHPIARARWPMMHLGFHEPSALDAWPKILDFFARSLSGSPQLHGGGSPSAGK